MQKPAIVDDCICINPHSLFTSTQIVQDSDSNLTVIWRYNSFSIEKTKFNVDATKELEQWIDAYHNQLPPLRNFILPVSVWHDVWKCQMVFYSKLCLFMNSRSEEWTPQLWTQFLLMHKEAWKFLTLMQTLTMLKLWILLYFTLWPLTWMLPRSYLVQNIVIPNWNGHCGTTFTLHMDVMIWPSCCFY